MQSAPPAISVASSPAVTASAGAKAAAGNRWQVAGAGAVVCAVSTFVPALFIDVVEPMNYVLGGAIWGAIVGAWSASYRWIYTLAVLLFLVVVFQ